MRILAIIFSLSLHALVLSVVLFLGARPGPRIDLNAPVYNVRLVSVAPGSGPSEKPSPKPAEPAPEPESEPEATQPEPEKPEAKPVEAPTKPKPAPPKKVESEPEPPKAKKPPAKPEPKKISPEKKQTKVAKPKKREPEKPPEPSPEEILSQALSSAKTEAAKREASRRRQVDQELAQLRRQTEQSAGETGGGAGGQGASGVVEVYAAIVEDVIKRNWRYPAIGQDEELYASVEIEIDQSGRITGRRLVWGSGKPEFDASVLKAVSRTGELPEPPTRDISKITINFNLQELNP